MEGMRATRQMENMGPVGNTACQIFHSRLRNIEAGLASTDAIVSGRDRKRMMRRNKYEGKSPRVRDAEAYGIEGDRTDSFGKEESQILEDRLRNKVTDGWKKTCTRMDCKNRIAKRKSSNEEKR